MKSCFLLILLVLALINSARRLQTAPVASQGDHTTCPLKVLQASPTGMSQDSHSATASHSPQCWERVGCAVSEQLRSKEPGNTMDQEKQRETNGQRRQETQETTEKSEPLNMV